MPCGGGVGIAESVPSPPPAWTHLLPEIELFTCPRHTGGLRLTTLACAANWRKHKDATADGRFHPCHACPIGAVNAGEPAPGPRDTSNCCYCGRPARRLICKSLCVSCFNRVREVITGRWRRQLPPGLAKKLHAFTVDFEDQP